VTFIQFKICCCVQNFIEIGWFFTEIWRYNDFQNGGRPPPWNCFTIIRDHPRSLCCWPHLPVKFSCQSDTHIWRYSYLNSDHQNGNFVGLWTAKCYYSSSRPPKGTSLRKSASFKLSTVKIRWGVWPVGELTESVTDTHTDRQTHTGKFIFCPCTALDRQKVQIRWYGECNHVASVTNHDHMIKACIRYWLRGYWLRGCGYVVAVFDLSKKKQWEATAALQPTAALLRRSSEPLPPSSYLSVSARVLGILLLKLNVSTYDASALLTYNNWNGHWAIPVTVSAFVFFFS